MTNTAFIRLLKEYTDIDTEFINMFFKKFKIGEELNFEITDKDVAKYLEIQKSTLRDRLLNRYSKKKLYIENVDYIRVKTGKTSGVTFLLNYPCFEKISMNGDSQKSDSVRMYFVKLRQFLTENQHFIYQSLTNKDLLRKYSGFETIYFFVIDVRYPDIIKLGRSKDIIQRLRNYNTGRISEVHLKYLALVKNSVLVEKCIKLRLKKNQLYENNEIYKVEPEQVKKIVDDCYCKYVSMKENKKMYEEISELLGLYAYTKDKINIKPFIVIG